MFRRQCKTTQVLRDWWIAFISNTEGRATFGPFSKLAGLLQEFNLTLDRDFKLWFSQNGWIDVLECSDNFLERLLIWFARQHFAAKVSARAGFADLSGFDFDLSVSADGGYTSAETEQLMIVRDGSFITDHAKSHYDARISNLCQWCNQPADRNHKYAECSRYDEVRAKHNLLFQEWDALPVSFREYGLVPANPWQTLLWEAFSALPDETTSFRMMPVGNTWHIFTDGSCTSPGTPEEALASWAAVWAGHGSISSGVLCGPQQCILRAELTAAISALRWGCRFQGDLHLWIDNLTVVNHLRELISGAGDVESYEHTDLWRQADALVRNSLATIHVHKAVGHDLSEWSEGALDDFSREWNTRADEQAKLANCSRPLFFDRIWLRFKGFRDLWKRRVSLLVAFHSDVAALDCSRTQDTEEDNPLEQEVSPIDFDWAPNSAELSVQLQPFQGTRHLFDVEECPRFADLGLKLVDWLISQDSSASSQRHVSHLELYFGFRLSLGGDPLTFYQQVVGSFCVVTVAADFRYFKTLLKALFEGIGIPWVSCTINLTAVNIIPPQPAILMGLPIETAGSILQSLAQFVGNRPVTNQQGLAKPWNP